MEVVKSLSELLHVLSGHFLLVGFHYFRSRKIIVSVEIGHIS
jgi:hypothetical protein